MRPGSGPPRFGRDSPEGSRGGGGTGGGGGTAHANVNGSAQQPPDLSHQSVPSISITDAKKKSDPKIESLQNQHEQKPEPKSEKLEPKQEQQKPVQTPGPLHSRSPSDGDEVRKKMIEEKKKEILMKKEEQKKQEIKQQEEAKKKIEQWEQSIEDTFWSREQLKTELNREGNFMALEI